MAGDWIKMRSDLFTHPKVVRISSALKADTLRTVGGLMSVWCLFDAHSADGILEGYTPETLDAHLRWPGFADAMLAVQWLEVRGESLALPEFETHNGASAKRRAQDADRKRTVRNSSASEADKKRTREEKRREEKKEQKQETGASASGSRLPADWKLPPEWAEWARAERSDVDAQAEAAKFADFWHGKAGKDGRKADWFATWRNWIRRADAPKRGRGPAGDVFAGAL